MTILSANVCNKALLNTFRAEPEHDGRTRYRVAGERYTFREVRERVPATVSDGTLGARLRARFENTWEQLSECPVAAKRRSGVMFSKRMEQRKQFRMTMQREHDERRARERAGHKSL
jgi:hypothetical protein